MRIFRFFLVFFMIISGLLAVSCGEKEQEEEYYDLEAEVKCSDTLMEIYNTDNAHTLKNIYVKLLPCGHDIEIEEELKPQHKMTIYLRDFTKGEGERYNAMMYKYDEIEIRATSIYILSGLEVKGVYERLENEPGVIITPIK